MSEEAWRPLGVETDAQVAGYDALHDGVPPWLQASFWAWIGDAVMQTCRYNDGSGRVPMLDSGLAERMCQTLRIPLPNLRSSAVHPLAGQNQRKAAVDTLTKHEAPLQIADYLLAHDSHARQEDLSALLERGKSAWQVGTRSGKPGLVRRVPDGVQVAADSVMTRTGRAGVRLAAAWEQLYGISPSASESYRLAILAVEDVAVPIVSPTNASATLGTVLRQLEDQKDWKLPMGREHAGAPSGDVVVSMLRLLWHGQHDRHGGQPSAPGNVSAEEATIAVSLAVALVHWFDAGLIERTT